MVRKTSEDREHGRRRVVRGETRQVSEDYGVTSVWTEGGATKLARKTPCKQCPFRSDVPTGVFPSEAFRESAHTSYDAAQGSFACHMSKMTAPATCAGFLMLHSDNNLGVRMAQMFDRLDLSEVSEGGFPLYRSYREMAIANGVDPDDPVLRQVRGNGDPFLLPDRDRNADS